MLRPISTAAAAAVCAMYLGATAGAKTVAYWRFEEGAGQYTAVSQSDGSLTAPNGIGCLRNGSLTLGSSPTGSGRYDPVWVLGQGVNGSNVLDYLHDPPNNKRSKLVYIHADNLNKDVPDNDLIQRGSFTVEAFIKPKRTLTSEHVGSISYSAIVALNCEGDAVMPSNFTLRQVEDTDGGNNFIEAYFTANTRYTFPSGTLPDRMERFIVRNPTVIEKDKWYYVAMQWDQTTRNLTTIVNNVSASAVQAAPTAPGTSAPTTLDDLLPSDAAKTNVARFTIGVLEPNRNVEQDYSTFDGLIDEVRISDSLLSAEQLLRPCEWTVDGDGNWTASSNWTGAVPNNLGVTASFGTIASATRNVTVDGTPTVGALSFSSPVTYNLTGANPITLDVGGGQAYVNVTAGSHTVATPVILNKNTMFSSAASTGIALTGELTATGKTITKAGTGSVQFEGVRASALALNAGSVKIRAKGTANDPAGTTVLTALSIATGAQLDLTNNSMILDYTGGVGTLVDDMRVMLQDGRLASSAAGGGTVLGYGDNALLGKTTFAGQSVDADTLLVKFTYAGDVNLDGQVDITDLGNLATSWQSAGVWTAGDSDYSGFIDITDLGALATNWQVGVGAPLGQSFESALAAVGLGGVAVPEPASLCLICIGTLALRRRS